MHHMLLYEDVESRMRINCGTMDCTYMFLAETQILKDVRMHNINNISM